MVDKVMGVLYFLLVVEAIGFLALPLVSFLTKDFKEGGQFFSKQLGLVVIVLTAWGLSSLKVIGFGLSIYFGVLFLAILSFLVFRYRGLSLNRENVFIELVFLSAFMVAIFYLMHKPEIYFSYSEDFMDFAFLNSILGTEYFPPVDPWFAGHDLNYYYFGHLISAVLIKLSGIEPQIGYNLAVAAFYSMAVQTAFGVGHNLVGRKLYGLVTVVLTLVMGFISGLFQLLAFLWGSNVLQYESFTGNFSEWVFNFDFSSANRIIPDTLELYPSFTFLQGDLHAHFMSLAFQLAFIGLCLAVYRRFNLYTFSFALIFSLFFIRLDIWSFPTYFILLMATAYFATRNRVFLLVLAAIGAAFLVTLNTELIGFVDQRTELLAFLQIFPLFFFVLLAYVFFTPEWRSARMLGILAALFLIVLIVGFIIGFQLAFLLVLVGFLLYQLLSEKAGFPAVVAATALLLVLFCELFFINDSYTDPHERLNTVMKFYLQVWVLWGVASAFFLSRARNKAVIAVAVFLIAASTIHPVLTSFTMPNSDYMGYTENLTLNGMEWLQEQHPGEYNAIKWLDNKSGVVLEAPGEVYQYSSRVSTFTGLPTLVGWKSHEKMWGKNWETINEREEAAQDIYLKNSYEIMEKYNVKYIFFGEVEYKRYGSIELGPSENLQEVYREGDVVIYMVKP
ncbi:MAG: DUF2298 domain-containing protein [Archaeoglobaceae archaeon]